jgi:hypothetical protein
MIHPTNGKMAFFDFSDTLERSIDTIDVAKSLWESNQIKSNQIKSNQIKSNQIKSNQIKSNQIGSRPNWKRIGGHGIYWPPWQTPSTPKSSPKKKRKKKRRRLILQHIYSHHVELDTPCVCCRFHLSNVTSLEHPKEYPIITSIIPNKKRGDVSYPSG